MNNAKAKAQEKIRTKSINGFFFSPNPNNRLEEDWEQTPI